MRLVKKMVYSELHRLARHYREESVPDIRSKPWPLVNEAYIRLIYWSNVQWQDRALERGKP